MITERQESEMAGHKVIIEFRSSSTQKGAEGYRVVVSDQAEEVDVEAAVEIAKLARKLCLEALNEENIARAAAMAKMARGDGATQGGEVSSIFRRAGEEGP